MPPRVHSNTVPETLLKKRKKNEDLRAAQNVAALIKKNDRRAKKATKFRSAEKFVKEFRQTEKDSTRFKRLSKKTGNYHADAAGKLALVIRIRGIVGVSTPVKKILHKLRLRQQNQAVFIQLTPETLEQLKLVGAYIAWGEPSMKNVKELIYKRGFGRIENKRVPLTDNTLIEKELGAHGIICMEDIVHEVFSLGPNFKAAASFLWPFHLAAPIGGFEKLLGHFKEGGDMGNRGNKISTLLEKML